MLDFPEVQGAGGNRQSSEITFPLNKLYKLDEKREIHIDILKQVGGR